MARPISEAQRAACQQNAQKSTGPRTAAGKNKARLNALTHGLTAKLPVLPFEDPAEFQALHDGFVQDFAPQSTYQRFLTTQLATHAWRILRSQQVEIGLQELLLKQTIHDLEAKGHDTANALAQNPYAGLALTLQPLEDDPRNQLLRNLFRYTSEIQSQFHRTRKALAEALKPPSTLKTIESTTPRFVSEPAPIESPAPEPVAPAHAEAIQSPTCSSADTSFPSLPPLPSFAPPPPSTSTIPPTSKSPTACPSGT